MMDLMMLEVLSNQNESVADSGRGTTLWKVTPGQAGHWAGNSLSGCSQRCCGSGTAPAPSQTSCVLVVIWVLQRNAKEKHSCD